MTGDRRRRGVALIVVLLMVSLIVAVTIQFNRDSRSEIYDAANLSDGIRLHYVARSGFYVGGAALLADKNQFDAFTEPWAKAELLSLKSDSYFDNASFKLFVEDEGGKIGINRLLTGTAYNVTVRGVLLRLLTGPHFRMENQKAEDLLEAIKDWIDGDDDVTGNGAEGAYYGSLPRPYRAKNAPMDCIEELLMVKGVTRELFYGTGESPGLAQCLTVYGEGKVNLNTAPLPVLLALADAMTPELVKELDEYRRDEGHDLADVGWYQRLQPPPGLNMPAVLLSVRSEIFRITSVGLQGAMTEQITGVVARDADRRKLKILSWKVR